jgi:hypothetical protein
MDEEGAGRVTMEPRKNKYRVAQSSYRATDRTTLWKSVTTKVEMVKASTPVRWAGTIYKPSFAQE